MKILSFSFVIVVVGAFLVSYYVVCVGRILKWSNVSEIIHMSSDFCFDKKYVNIVNGWEILRKSAYVDFETQFLWDREIFMSGDAGGNL